MALILSFNQSLVTAVEPHACRLLISSTEEEISASVRQSLKIPEGASLPPFTTLDGTPVISSLLFRQAASFLDSSKEPDKTKR